MLQSATKRIDRVAGIHQASRAGRLLNLRGMRTASPGLLLDPSERSMLQIKPKRSETGQSASQSYTAPWQRFHTLVSIGLIAVSLLLTPAWAGLLAWGLYKIVRLVFG